MAAGLGGAAAGYCGATGARSRSKRRIVTRRAGHSRPDPAPRVPVYRRLRSRATRTATCSDRSIGIPYAASRPYTPPEATFYACRALHARLGVSRAVIVNATPYGRDNRVMVDAIAASGGAYRGIGNIDERMTDRELETLADGGVDGCRFTFSPAWRTTRHGRVRSASSRGSLHSAGTSICISTPGISTSSHPLPRQAARSVRHRSHGPRRRLGWPGSAGLQVARVPDGPR